MKLFTTFNTNLKKSLWGLVLIWSGSAYAQVLVNENFSTANGYTPPSNWLNEDAGGSGAQQIWRFDNPANRIFTGGNPGFSGKFAIMDSDYNGGGATQNCNLVTPAFDASVAGNYKLEFDDNWEDIASIAGQVQVFNGTAWVTVLSESTDGSGDGYEDPSVHRTIDITSATGSFNAAKVRFHFEAAWSYWWAIDNVKITRLNCTPPTAAFSTVTDCPNNQYSVNVNVSNMGSATSLSLSNGVTTYGAPITTTGNYVAGPFASNTSQTVTLIHNDSFCNVAQNISFACPPPNDSCIYALEIPVGNGVATTAVVSTTEGATFENNMFGAYCSNLVSNDIWFKATVPSSGNITIQSSALSAFMGTDVVMEAYSGVCGNLTFIDCDDNGNPDTYPSSAHARIKLTGQTAGSIIYIRIKPYDGTQYGPVAMAAWDPATPAVATTGICDAAVPITIDSISGNLYRWVPILDVSGKIIAEIHPRGNVLGTVNASLFVNEGAVRQANGVYYLDRNVTITPAIQPLSNVDIRIYALASELNALAAMDTAVTYFGNLNISKSQEGCLTAVNAATAQITQSASQGFTDGTPVDAGYIEFGTASFSSFYLRSGTTPLPIVVKSISAKNLGAFNQVDWTTLSETSTDGFELERSADGKTFAFLSKIEATGRASFYSYKDNKPFAGDNYYRLKLIENNGKQDYSITVKATMNSNDKFALEAYPNPVNNVAKVKVYGSGEGDLFVTDLSGKVVLQAGINSSETDIDFSSIAPGVYFIRYTDGNFSKTIKIVR